jgi:hypothetical protein
MNYASLVFLQIFIFTFISFCSCSFKQRSKSSISLCLNQYTLLRDAVTPFWIAKHTPSSLDRGEKYVYILLMNFILVKLVKTWRMIGWETTMLDSIITIPWMIYSTFHNTNFIANQLLYTVLNFFVSLRVNKCVHS